MNDSNSSSNPTSSRVTLKLKGAARKTDSPRAKMADQMLVFYGSYRSDRLGIRLADFIVSGLRARGESAELIDAKAVGLPMLDRMYKEFPVGTAPPAMESLAAKIRSADAFI